MSRTTSSFKGPMGPLRHRCPQCTATGPQLLRCSACRAVRYCSREHQIAHRPLHKSACNRIQKARAKVDKEDDLVRNGPDDGWTPANAFETHVGRFWGLYHTRDYMRARFVLAGERLLGLGTLDAVHEALEHMQDMLRLCHGDNMGLRDIVPAIMLRLDLDQECYDFVKWWATTDASGTYDWDATTAPHIDLCGADVFEDPAFLDRHFSALNSIIAVLLLKLKLIVDVRNVKIVRKIASMRGIPFDVRLPIESAVVRSPLSAGFARHSWASLAATEHTLLDHIRRLGAWVVKANENFMHHLFDPDEALNDRPEAYSKGSWEEMALAMQYSYATWWETEGVLDLLNDARVCAGQDSESEVKDLVQQGASSPCANSHLSAEELLANVSVNRIWGYIDWAIENASFLGPRSERPSKRHMEEIRSACEIADDEYS